MCCLKQKDFIVKDYVNHLCIFEHNSNISSFQHDTIYVAYVAKCILKPYSMYKLSWILKNS